MSKKLLEIEHHLCSGCCMWSGIEDVYQTMTQEVLPEAFFFCMASYGENVYLKFNNNESPRMFSTADGRTSVTYNHLKDILGLQYKISGGRSFEYALKSIKKEIDEGRPVILGPLDMYHLKYVKMYHQIHIPMHYVLMVGYDEEASEIYIYDCDREDLQTLSIKDLKSAWQIEKNVVGDKNGFVRFLLAEDYKSAAEIVDYSMRRKAKEQLQAKGKMAGINAFRKIAAEFPKWEKELSQEAYKNALKGLPEYWGTVPKLPNRLMGIEEEERNVRYHGGCDRMGNVLVTMGERENRKEWCEAGEKFKQCGFLFEAITERIISFLCDGEETLREIPNLFLKIAALEEKAYQAIIKEQS